MQKPRLSFWQIWNMSFGFLGIQFGWGLQMANMSPIYKYLGASDEQIPLLWLAAPLTGFIVQPIIGAMSDRTWSPLGRRRPYFLAGALFSVLWPWWRCPTAAALDGRGPALDSRRFDQRLHGALPRLRGRQAARPTARRRLCHAELLHRRRRRRGRHVALDPEKLLPCQQRDGRRERHSNQCQNLLLRGRRGFHGRGALDRLHEPGVSTGEP